MNESLDNVSHHNGLGFVVGLGVLRVNGKGTSSKGVVCAFLRRQEAICGVLSTLVQHSS